MHLFIRFESLKSLILIFGILQAFQFFCTTASPLKTRLTQKKKKMLLASKNKTEIGSNAKNYRQNDSYSYVAFSVTKRSDALKHPLQLHTWKSVRTFIVWESWDGLISKRANKDFLNLFMLFSIFKTMWYFSSIVTYSI